MSNIKGRKHYIYSFKLKVVLDIIKYKSFSYVIRKYKISSNSARTWYDRFHEDTLKPSNGGKHLNHNRIIDIDCDHISELNKEQLIAFESILKLKSMKWSRIKKYEYIYNTKQNISYLCRILNITRSSYYKWVNNGRNKINAYKKDIENYVVSEYNFHKIKFGYRRLRMQIQRNYGVTLSEYYVRKYMKINGLRGKSNQKTKFKISKNVKQLQVTPNYINGVFRSSKVNTKWYMDYTFVRVGQKFNYILFLLDGYNKEIVNYLVVESKTPKVTKNMLVQTIKNRKVNCKELIVHNDQGCEFNNVVVNSYLVNKNIKQSFSKKGTPLQNALMESTISNFKRDFNPDNEKIENKKHLLKLVDAWVIYYNHIIPQKSLDYKTPCEY